jgi:hypothetical protein
MVQQKMPVFGALRKIFFEKSDKSGFFGVFLAEKFFADKKSLQKLVCHFFTNSAECDIMHLYIFFAIAGRYSEWILSERYLTIISFLSQ